MLGRLRTAVIATSGLLSAFFSAGLALAMNHRISFNSPWLYLCWGIAWLAMALLMLALLRVRGKRSFRSTCWEGLDIRTYLLGAAVVLCLVWGITLLAGWPGFFTYDTSFFLRYLEDGYLTTYQPVIHVMFVGEILRFGTMVFPSFNMAVAFYFVIQQAICLFITLFFLRLLMKEGVSKRGIVITAGYFALNPCIMLMTSCTTKDTLFSYYLLGLFTCLLWRVRRSGEGHSRISAAGLFVFTFLVLSYRNNALPAFAVFIPIVVFTLRKERSKLVALCIPLIAGMCVALLFTGPFSTYIGVERSSSAREMISIPTMEIANVCSKNEEMCSLVDEAGIDSAELVRRYSINDSNSDPIRTMFWDLLDTQGLSKILSLWMQARSIDFASCVEADMLLTEASWSPFSVMDGYEGIYQTSTPSYGFSPIAEAPAQTDSKISAVYDILYRLSRYNTPQYVGPLYVVMSVFPYVWFLICCFALSVEERASAGVMPTSFMLLLTMTNWLGPVAIMRYYFPLIVFAPLLAWYCLVLSNSFKDMPVCRDKAEDSLANQGAGQPDC